ncbi:MAG TPA: DMT family transporter [Sphingomonadaceae bacterium]
MSSHNERAGLLWVLAGFSTLAVGDAIVKGMPGAWPATAMAATRYVFAAIGLTAILVSREGWGALRMPRPGIQWLRGLGVSLGSVGMFAAVWLMPLADAITISFTQPMITALLAALVLREPAKPAAIVATVISFIGVIIVLRPNFAAVGWGAFLPLLTALGMSVLMIANRTVAGLASVLAMQAYIAITASGFLLVVTVVGHFSGLPQLHLHWPHWSVIARMAFISVSASFAQWFIYMGTMKAGPGNVAPMSYGQLLTAVVLGWVFFHEAPDLIAILGAAIIVGSGLFLWRAGRMPEPLEHE